jgi:hypothetical protein
MFAVLSERTQRFVLVLERPHDNHNQQAVLRYLRLEILCVCVCVCVVCDSLIQRCAATGRPSVWAFNTCGS